MRISITCPYCGAAFEMDFERESLEEPIKGPIQQKCSSCGATIDILRIALVSLAKRRSSSSSPYTGSGVGR